MCLIVWEDCAMHDRWQMMHGNMRQLLCEFTRTWGHNILQTRMNYAVAHLNSGDASENLLLNLAVALLDLEEALGAPSSAPAVGAQPVWGVVFGAPTKNLDGVAALGGELKEALVVDTLGVGEERLVNHEASLNRSVGVDLLLDIVNSLELVAALGLGASEGRRVLASGGAGGSSGGSSNIGEAGISQKTSLGDVLPSLVQIATAAALVDSVARHEVLGGVAVGGGALHGSVGCDGSAVRKNLGSRNSPARAALALVTDGVNVLRPLGAGVKFGRKVLKLEVVMRHNRQVIVGLEDGSEKAASL